LDSEYSPIIFHIIGHLVSKQILEPIEKFRDLEQFQSLASNLVSPAIEINSRPEPDKVARCFTASIASDYSLSTTKVTISDLNNDLPGRDRLLKHKKKLTKLGQETGTAACKMAINWVGKSIRQIVQEGSFNAGENIF
jgi:hypothetical protein